MNSAEWAKLERAIREWVELTGNVMLNEVRQQCGELFSDSPTLEATLAVAVCRRALDRATHQLEAVVK